MSKARAKAKRTGRAVKEPSRGGPMDGMGDEMHDQTRAGAQDTSERMSGESRRKAGDKARGQTGKRPSAR
ncbi:hypothetical protein QCN29_18430 [Streptomyces sp. HNM0663]|uniref:CsbD family protein n=1 Tax=Streptomyces chengmaiensis TaxID=3040919 RepID=A0ABT6HPU1_9ACTN|nr:hypothetical protein [Streptomyces chengmaiensis]MDH2390728.1 hypothetical protein [Streptomyces chengmaiensis]